MTNYMTAHTCIRVVDLICTPDDLRKLAGRMEKRMKQKHLGDSTLVEYIHGKKVTIAIRVDQDRI